MGYICESTIKPIPTSHSQGIYTFYNAELMRGQKAHTSDITLSLPSLTLYFPHPEQRLSLLKIISIPNSALILSYGDQVLHSSNQALTRGVVGRVLGPTYSGEGSSLVYPGVEFETTPPASGVTGKREDRIESMTIVTKDEGGMLPVINPLQSVTIQVRSLHTCNF